MLREIPDEMPQWASDLVQDLDHHPAECSHERSAYDNSALMVIEYWEDSGDGGKDNG